MINAICNYISVPVSYNLSVVPVCLPPTTLNTMTPLFNKTIELQWYDEDREFMLDGDSKYDQSINPKTQCDQNQWIDEMRHTSRGNREFNRNLKLGWGLADWGNSIYCYPQCMAGNLRMCAVSTVVNGLKNSIYKDIVLIRDDEPNSTVPKAKMLISDVVDTTIRLGNMAYYYPKCMAGSVPMCAAFAVINDMADTIKNDHILAGGGKHNSLVSRVKERISKTVDNAASIHLSYAISKICLQKRWKECGFHIMGNLGFSFVKNKL